MRFSKNRYYLEKYLKCNNCGVLIYDAGVKVERKGKEQLFCSDWCVEWSALRESGKENIRLPLQQDLQRMGGPAPKMR
jgi:5-oxoprolinase (ATP-hydrolysing)/N-methylhydantoinase B